MAIIYEIRNTLTGATYVGSTCVSLDSRWKRHRTDLRAGRHHSQFLQRAWRKYGETAFVICASVECPDGEVRKIEQEFLDRRFEELPRSLNYNMSNTAHGGARQKRSQETRRRLSESHKGIKPTKRALQRLRRTWHNKGRHLKLKSPQGKTCTVGNIREFARKHGLQATTVGAVLRGKMHNHKGWTRVGHVEQQFGLVDPTGRVFAGITNLKAFSREHGLSYKTIHGVATGLKKSYRRWTKL